MIRILLFLALLGAVALGIGWLADQPGGISLVWQGYRIETSVVVALAAVLALAVLLAVLWAVLRAIFNLPATWSLSSRNRRRTKGYTSVSRGLVAIGSGDSSLARRHASEAERLLGREPLTLLLKAQAAQIAGDREGAETAFNQMLETSETRVLGFRGLFVEARRKGDDVAARTYAEKANQLAPKVAWASEAMLEYQSGDKDWRGALQTLEQQTRLKAIDKETSRRLRAVLLTADARTRQEMEPEAALSAVTEAVKFAPDLVPAAIMKARLLARDGGSLKRAAKVLEAAWKREPHPDLAAAYVDLRPGDSAHDRLERARALAAIVPHHPESRLVLTATALEARDFALARNTLTPLLRDRPTRRACLLMADIAEEEHGMTGEWREWIGRASRAPRDAAWLADGVISETWQPVSPVTGKLDAFRWGMPIEQLDDHGLRDSDHEHGSGHGAENAVLSGQAVLAPAAAAATAASPAPTVPEPVAVQTELAETALPPLEEASVEDYAKAAEAIAPVQEQAATVAAPSEPIPVSEPQEQAPMQPAPVAPASPVVAVEAGEARSGETSNKDVVFPLRHAPDDPGPDAPDPDVEQAETRLYAGKP